MTIPFRREGLEKTSKGGFGGFEMAGEGCAILKRGAKKFLAPAPYNFKWNSHSLDISLLFSHNYSS